MSNPMPTEVRQQLARLHAAVEGPTVEIVLSAHGAALGDADQRTRDYTAENGTFFDVGFLDDAFITVDFTEQKARDEVEVMEDVVGCAFVMVQTYITRVISRVDALARAVASSLRTPLKVFSQGRSGVMRWPTKPSPANPFTKIELIDAVADWWKHRDSWPSDWKEDPNKFPTMAKILSLGIDSNESGRLLEVAGRFGLSAPPTGLAPLWEIAQTWAREVEASIERELTAAEWR